MTADESKAMHRVCLWLELASGLAYPGQRKASGWSFDEWWELLRKLDARHARVVVLRLVHGMGSESISKRLGVTKQRVRQLFKAATTRLAQEKQVKELCA